MVSMGMAAGPQGENSGMPPVPSAAALRAVGGSRNQIAGQPSHARRGLDKQGKQVLEKKDGNRQSVGDVVFGVDFTTGCVAPARGVHQKSTQVWEAFHAWETRKITSEAMIHMIEGKGIHVNSKAKNAIACDSQLNFQQLLFMLNEAEALHDQKTSMGLPTKPSFDIKGHKKPSHEGQVHMGAFQRQRDDEFLTSVINPSCRPARTNECSAANPMSFDPRVRAIDAEREPLDARERAQVLVRQYTEGAIKGDVFAKGLLQMGIDARPGSTSLSSKLKWRMVTSALASAPSTEPSQCSSHSPV